jgi:hypothetical protein
MAELISDMIRDRLYGLEIWVFLPFIIFGQGLNGSDIS